MKLIVAGSRTITEYGIVCDAIDNLVNRGVQITLIIDGAARGVDSLASRYANEHGIENLRVPADWKKFRKGAGKARNLKMAQTGDALLAIWDGQSRGTKHMIDVARKQGLRVFIKSIPDGEMYEPN